MKTGKQNNQKTKLYPHENKKSKELKELKNQLIPSAAHLHRKSFYSSIKSMPTKALSCYTFSFSRPSKLKNK
jgi:hypothetical protein